MNQLAAAHERGVLTPGATVFLKATSITDNGSIIILVKSKGSSEYIEVKPENKVVDIHAVF